MCVFPLSVKKSIKAANPSKLNCYSAFHLAAPSVIVSITSLNDGAFENTSIVKRYSLTSAILTILEMVAMSEERLFSKLDSLRALNKPKVYSSIYLHESQNHKAKVSLNLADRRGRSNLRTHPSLDCSRSSNILGIDAQTESPKRTEAKAIAVASSTDKT